MSILTVMSGVTILDDAVDAACREPTLGDALAWISVWQTLHGPSWQPLHGSSIHHAHRGEPVERVLQRYREPVARVLQRYPAIPHVYEECASECDTQAADLTESLDRGDYDNDPAHARSAIERAIGMHRAYRDAADHIRDLGKSAAARIAAASERAVPPLAPIPGTPASASTAASIPASTSTVEPPHDADLLLARLRRARNRILDLRDEYASGARDVRRLGQGVVGALLSAVEAVSDGLDAEQIELANAERRRAGVARRTASVSTPARGEVQVSPTLLGRTRIRFAGSTSECEIHDTPTEGLPRRIYDSVKTSLINPIAVCLECRDRVVEEAERERRATVP